MIFIVILFSVKTVEGSPGQLGMLLLVKRTTPQHRLPDFSGETLPDNTLSEFFKGPVNHLSLGRGPESLLERFQGLFIFHG